MVKPEEKARYVIDGLLEASGWRVQNYHEFNLGEAVGVAIREFSLSNGIADYLLFVNRKAVGVIEAKSEGTTLSGVAEQTAKYLEGIPYNLITSQTPPCFAYETTGGEIYFRDLRDPEARSRRVFAFHKPETLTEWLSQNLLIIRHFQYYFYPKAIIIAKFLRMISGKRPGKLVLFKNY